MNVKPVVWILSILLFWIVWPASAPSAQANAPARRTSSCVDDTWTPTSMDSAPSRRSVYTAVWTGTEMIVWGGAGDGRELNTGGRYDPATDTWTALSTEGAPSARAWPTAVWTGTEMLVWGGRRLGPRPTYFNTGGRYDPATDTWAAISTEGAPSPRELHTAVWTGKEMIVWGGFYYDGIKHDFNTGGRYDPETDTWTPTSMDSAPSGRDAHTAVWTGSEMIVWGGYGGRVPFPTFFNTGGRYDPVKDTWAATRLVGTPSARIWHTAVWTGLEMIVWGGAGPGGVFLNTGGRYDPATDIWTATSLDGVPDPRGSHTAVWTGTEMIVWGGYGNTGGRYDPATDMWAATNVVNAPSPRYDHTAVWTGSEMLVWGGSDNDYLNTGGRYCASAGKEAVAASGAGERVGRGKALIISLLIAPSMIEFSDLVRVNIDGYG